MFVEWLTTGTTFAIQEHPVQVAVQDHFIVTTLVWMCLRVLLNLSVLSVGFPSFDIAKTWNPSYYNTWTSIDCARTRGGITVQNKNYAKLIDGQSTSCTNNGGIYRYSTVLGTLNWYPNPTGNFPYLFLTKVAGSWDPNWGSPKQVDCSQYPTGPTMIQHNAKNYNDGWAYYCSTHDFFGSNSGAVYRYVSSTDTFNHYPSAYVADSWDSNWRAYGGVDCTGYQLGSDMTVQGHPEIPSVSNPNAGSQICEFHWSNGGGNVQRANVDRYRQEILPWNSAYGNGADRCITICSNSPKCTAFYFQQVADSTKGTSWSQYVRCGFYAEIAYPSTYLADSRQGKLFGKQYNNVYVNGVLFPDSSYRCGTAGYVGWAKRSTIEAAQDLNATEIAPTYHTTESMRTKAVYAVDAETARKHAAKALNGTLEHRIAKRSYVCQTDCLRGFWQNVVDIYKNVDQTKPVRFSFLKLTLVP